MRLPWNDLLYAVLFTLLTVLSIQYAATAHCFLIHGPRSFYYPSCIQTYHAIQWRPVQYATLFSLLPLLLLCSTRAIPERWSRGLAILYAVALIFVCFGIREDISLFELSSLAYNFDRTLPAVPLRRPYVVAFALLLFVAWRLLEPRRLLLLLVVPALLEFGIPVAENKLNLHGNEDPRLLFIHTRHLFDHGFFAYDPNDAIGRAPDLIQPLFHVLSVTVSRATGVDPLFTWPILCFLSTVTSSFLIYLIAQKLLRDDRLAALTAVFAFAVCYRTLAWTHPEVLGYTLSLGSIYALLCHLEQPRWQFTIVSGILLGAAALTYATTLVFAGGTLLALASGHALADLRRGRRRFDLFVPLLVAALVAAPYYWDLFSKTSFRGVRVSYVGLNWFPFQCTDTLGCSPIFSGFSVSLLALFAWSSRRATNRLTVLLLLAPVTVLLFNVVPYHLGWTDFFVKCDRFSSYAWALPYALAAVLAIRSLGTVFLREACAILALFCGVYYALEEGDGAAWDNRSDHVDHRFYAWIRSNVSDDALFLLTDSGQLGTSWFYTMTGRDYALPNTVESVGGTGWETGFISGSSYHEKVIERVDEWLALDQGDASELRGFFARYGLTHVIHCLTSLESQAGQSRSRWRAESRAVYEVADVVRCDDEARCCLLEFVPE